MAEQKYKHGEMDITTQEKTFNSFIRISMNVAIFCIGVVIFLALFAR
ncbi:aa3-type cytochrome c oxidase subunit IV [Rhodophyticola sp. CCM32]|nr:aa3-type cytochrome c oxidase subunit IV [Rhodophyticola sp. CCM32]QBY02255.1 aa3-type cytochrome c oxidase subunit IV [Rhodophyticola sp. CCM32]